MKKIIRILWLFPPILVIVGPAPLILSLPPFYLGNIANYSFSLAFITIVYYVGLFSFPGYIYVVFFNSNEKLQNKIIWVRTSLWVASISCGVAIFLGYMLPFYSFTAFVTLLLCIRLLYRFEREKKKIVSEVGKSK